jgi:6-phosphogluconolactonase
VVHRQTLGGIAALLLSAAPGGAADYLVYAGGSGIHAFQLQSQTGKLKALGLAAETSNPAFLVEHPDHRFLYAANRDAAGKVSAFLIDPRSGKLSLVNQAASQGEAPCHLALDRSGRYLAVANCDSGSIAVLPLRQDGGLGAATAFVQPSGSGVDARRQTGPHSQALLFSPDNRFLLAAGPEWDKILIYRFDAVNGTLAPAASPFTAAAPGSGVAGLAFHPSGKILYALDEMAASVTTYQYEAATGALEELQTVSALPAGYAGPHSAGAIAVNPPGTMVYASVRGADLLALLRIDAERLTLAPLEYTPLLGRTPRHFALDPSGTYLVVANQDSDSLSVFKVHPRTGQIQPAGRSVTGVAQPTSVVFVPI